ncbi:palmitoyl-(protein) hydrolase [Teratosphaeria destructans]|uniref:palmitoyl-protein hydrolase n=1 Tax=Teratosphaeria destructans TaxID=418781 RepID=A0A9W7T0C8_9PEZI|nr:palmitoyl-(protein) hydrolase [Teratosphaeria destructans]
MKMLLLFPLPALLAAFAYTSATLHNAAPPKPLPLLIWHGLGDKYDAEGLRSAGALAQDVYPGTYVYYIHLDEDGNQDRTSSFFGNVTEQIVQVCKDLREDPRLRLQGSEAQYQNGKVQMRVDALGFSQGGQFLRGLLERCDGLQIRSLVTFGSQHNGIAQFQTCGTFDFLCKGATALIKGNAWTEYVQGKVVPAQYYRTLNETTGEASEEYLEHSGFLADVNNERVVKREDYGKKVAGLEKFVMYVFEEDTTVIPKDSGWFAEVNMTADPAIVIPLQNRTIYKEDWVGLKALDEKDGLVFRTAPGGHMQLKEKELVDAYRTYFGPETREKGGALVGGCKGDGERMVPLLQDQQATSIRIGRWWSGFKEYL